MASITSRFISSANVRLTTAIITRPTTFTPVRSFGSTIRARQLFENPSPHDTTSGAHRNPARPAQHQDTRVHASAAGDTFSNSPRRVTDSVRIDHASVNELYERYVNTPENELTERQAIVNELIREISVHSEGEEIVLYPVIEQTNVGGKGHALGENLREEHLKVKQLLHEVDKMHVDDPQFSEKLGAVMQHFSEHAKEEEEVELPELEQKLSDTELRDLNTQFERAKTTSPTHPHPSAPQKTPLVKQAVGVAAAAADKAYDAVRDFADRRIK